MKSTPRTSTSSALAASLPGALAVCVGSAVLVGWSLDIAALKSVFPGWVSVKANAAVGFILIGTALLLSSTGSSTRSPGVAAVVPRLTRACALLAGAIGLLTLSEYLLDRDIGIDQWLFPESSGTAGTSHPGRMAPDSALCFVFLAMAVWLAVGSSRTKWSLVASAVIGTLVTTVALAALMAYFSPALRTQGWWNLTMMSPVTATMCAVLSVTIVLGSWRNALGPRLTQFSAHLWRMVGCVGALAIAFALYARSEGEIRRANELRHRSFLLADELRQSGDDLTLMSRTYVMTGDPVYKQHFQDILDIRDGRKARPDDYWQPYWDLVEGKSPVPRAGEQAIPLLDLMRQAEFTEEEFRELAEAKAHSDQLTIPELEAMKLVETIGPEAEANRARARLMLFDAAYFRAKAAVMQPIHDMLGLVDQRTRAGVGSAETSAAIFRYLLAASGVGLMFVLWRAYAALCGTLGGSVDEVATHIARIGSGDFLTAIPVGPGLHDSVLGRLSETQARLRDGDRERKRAEQARRASEEHFRAMFEMASVGMAQADPRTGQLLRVNQKVSRITGYSVEELLRIRVRDITHPDDRQKDWEAFQRVVRGEVPDYRMEKRYVRKDGTIAWVNVNVSVVRDADGQPARTVATIEDINDRKRAEDAVRESEARLDFALQVSGTGAWDLDLLDHTAHRSLQHDRIFGYATLLPAWTYEMFLDHVLPEDRAEVDRLFTQAITDHGDWGFECRIRRCDGALRWILASGRHRFDESGAARWMSGIVQDITERRQSEQAILRLNAELEQRVRDRTDQFLAANKELEAFSYSVSHDLRAPLRAIDGYGRMLVEDHEARLDAEGRRLLGVISAETRRMGQLIDDLLAFSRLGRQQLGSARLDMTAMAVAVVEEQTARAPTRVLQVDVKPLAPARGDRAMIRIALGNLIANAIKFTAPRTPAVIEIGSRQEHEQAVYYVKDNGVGFEMTYAHKLFGVFQRLHSAEEFEGTGVGLALVQRVIHRHGGRVWAEGKVDEGATFYFSLPNTEDDHE